MKFFNFFNREPEVNQKLLKQAIDRFYISVGSRFGRLLELSGAVNDDIWLKKIEDLCKFYGEFFYETDHCWWELTFQSKKEYIKFSFERERRWDKGRYDRIILHVYLDHVEFYCLASGLKPLDVEDHKHLIKILRNNESLRLSKV